MFLCLKIIDTKCMKQKSTRDWHSYFAYVSCSKCMQSVILLYQLWATFWLFIRGIIPLSNMLVYVDTAFKLHVSIIQYIHYLLFSFICIGNSYNFSMLIYFCYWLRATVTWPTFPPGINKVFLVLICVSDSKGSSLSLQYNNLLAFQRKEKKKRDPSEVFIQRLSPWTHQRVVSSTLFCL